MIANGTKTFSYVELNNDETGPQSSVILSLCTNIHISVYSQF